MIKKIISNMHPKLKSFVIVLGFVAIVSSAWQIISAYSDTSTTMTAPPPTTYIAPVPITTPISSPTPTPTPISIPISNPIPTPTPTPIPTPERLTAPPNIIHSGIAPSPLPTNPPPYLPTRPTVDTINNPDTLTRTPPIVGTLPPKEVVQLVETLAPRPRNMPVAPRVAPPVPASIVPLKITDLGGAIDAIRNTTIDSQPKPTRQQLVEFKQQDGELLFQDTNKDGISDYDSVYVYNIDPIKPSLPSTFEERTITAGDRILLGYDPTKTDLVKIVIEEPEKALATVVATYKVQSIAMIDSADKKFVVIKGQALPNSFITIYIYSTPTIVTVKTDSNGEWSYTMEKELENGDHTVYIATVNNTGNIVAKSTAFTFTKTAEAATLIDTPVAEAFVTPTAPGLASGNNLYFLIGLSILGVLLVLVLTGVMSKKKEILPTDNTSGGGGVV